ncbi:FAD-dependent monooxygenase [Lentzea sp. NPDC051838]|uniref:FAD-dependent oxidoreductase n=1 Tax=Lentzea sp. NPDC051838 TaxID=3154849 RepID=UPI00342F5DD1
MGTSAIVIGAGLGGLSTARVLSDHVDQVLVLERDRLPQEAVARPSVPQGRHAHVLLASGQRLLDSWFPGLADELAAGGAVRVPADPGFLSSSMSQPLLECTIRGLLSRQRPNVIISDETAVDGLLLENGRVVGVDVDGARHRADLVVACSGRHTRFLDQLAHLGFPAPRVSEVHIDVACGTCVVPRRPDDFTGALVVTVDDPVLGHRVGMMVPVEGDQWIITLASLHGDGPPDDPAAYEDFARSLPVPLIADALAQAEAVTPVMTYRMATSQRRHVEQLKRTPPGFVVLGDAICSFNPLHAQGMSSAALQARALGQAIARYGPSSPRLPRAFYMRAAKVIGLPWRIAARADAGTARPGP